MNNLTLISRNAATAGSPGDIVIADVFNVADSLLLNGRSLTVTTNGLGSFAPFGQINLRIGTNRLAGQHAAFAGAHQFGDSSRP